MGREPACLTLLLGHPVSLSSFSDRGDGRRSGARVEWESIAALSPVARDEMGWDGGWYSGGFDSTLVVLPPHSMGMPILDTLCRGRVLA